ncbi:tetratricopeptide repeat protein [Streptomyces sp. NPDC001914]|uniref:tetratricopeptide repeat protein n=1 Tax=Streptomyces sp. NPDC001914 TaxID=3364623 RepID=UPI0036A605AD
MAHLTTELGRWHPQTLAARSTVFMWLLEEDLHDDRLRLIEAEVAERTAEFGFDDPETLNWRRSLAWIRRRIGDLEGAVTDARAVVNDSVRVLGSEHADTHRCRAVLAQFLAENGEPAEGVRLLRALYDESRAFGHERWNETRSVRKTLVTALELNGDVTEALDLLDEEIAVESGTLYGVDDNLGDHEMKHLQEWRVLLAAKVSARPALG